MTGNLTRALIQNENELPVYIPPGRRGAVDIRLMCAKGGVPLKALALYSPPPPPRDEAPVGLDFELSELSRTRQCGG